MERQGCEHASHLARFSRFQSSTPEMLLEPTTAIHTMNNPTPIICLELTHHVNEPQSFRNSAHPSRQFCLTITQCNAWLNPTPRGDEMIPQQQSSSFFARGPISIRGQNNCFRVFLNWVCRYRATRSGVRRHPLSELPKSSRSWAKYTTRQHSPLDGHSELLPSPLWHSVAW